MQTDAPEYGKTPMNSTPRSTPPARATTTSTEAQRYAEANLPTEYGDFRVIAYRCGDHPLEHLAIVRGDVTKHEGVLTRVHSECLTGEVLHSLRCDCREQLDLALQRIAENNLGLVVYLRQEGRGIGLGNKLRAYALQEQGLDTVDANRALGFADDLRDYSVATAILRDLGVLSVRLMTNNPLKISALSDDGIEVLNRVPHQVPAHAHNAGYLETKRDRMGHRFAARGDNLAYFPEKAPTKRAS